MNNLPEMRAKRLKRLRNLANLTREEMCSNGKINRNTLIGWENARFGGLTLEGAKKILARIDLEKKDIYCSLEWLMDGTGPEPSVNPIFVMEEKENIELTEDLIIASEIAFFKTKNPQAINLLICDEGMLPEFQIGEYVAGKKKTGKNIRHATGYNCIVELENEELLIRNVREGKYRDTYTLVCNNPTVKKIPSIITDVKLLYAAPVIWHRKKDIIL
jgi:transcriptional regulator with XRE-family HTH domain